MAPVASTNIVVPRRQPPGQGMSSVTSHMLRLGMDAFEQSSLIGVAACKTKTMILFLGVHLYSISLHSLV